MPIQFQGERVLLVDQRFLPDKMEWFDATDLESMCFAIKDMVVRGAPSIGVAAAAGLALESVRLAQRCPDRGQFFQELSLARRKLEATRPTAVNLSWGTAQIYHFLESLLNQEGAPDLVAASRAAIDRTKEILEEHVRDNQRLSQYGAEVVPARANIITHCNAGPLAACGWGTALGVIRSAAARVGSSLHIYVDETRPRNQGAKLTMWELHQDKIPATLMCDSMSGSLMSRQKIDLVVVGADRIALNGDTANKIGTYNLAIVAQHHRVPFYIAAPLSTIDPGIATGESIPIEERAPEEVTSLAGTSLTVGGAQAYNPAFDVTPHQLIAGIITEKGVLRAPFTDSIKAALSSSLLLALVWLAAACLNAQPAQAGDSSSTISSDLVVSSKADKKQSFDMNSLRRLDLLIKGKSCAACLYKINRRAHALKGMMDARVMLKKPYGAVFIYDASKVSKDKILQTLKGDEKEIHFDEIEDEPIKKVPLILIPHHSEATPASSQPSSEQ